MTSSLHSFTLMGIAVRVVASAETTGGAFSVLEQCPTMGAGSPLHTISEAKVFTVIAGTFSIRRGREVLACSPGDAVSVPAGVPHAYRCTSAGGGRLLVVTLPGGHEQFLRGLAETVASGIDPRAAMRQIGPRHGVALVEEPTHAQAS